MPHIKRARSLDRAPELVLTGCLNLKLIFKSGILNIYGGFLFVNRKTNSMAGAFVSTSVFFVVIHGTGP